MVAGSSFLRCLKKPILVKEWSRQPTPTIDAGDIWAICTFGMDHGQRNPTILAGNAAEAR
ncbi:hypothetical protein CA54_50410 [Symmachiella macrocystis]|uniref:Uncharacterized protein n=1 Tax=Symmachiella macrocystis TaxID=2527985 RepID=A0A5C6B804_9PLAN|nr:hypothetical protein CA54_50410 [Symmachiella macrocystis]